MCETVCIGEMTRRCRFALARITDARRIGVSKDNVDMGVASVHCAVGICVVNDQQNGCDTTVLYFFRKTRVSLRPFR